jgi:hypothetical protein
MPELSRFYGLVVRMYYADHGPPHFHVYYGDDEAVLRIDTLEIVRGELPRRALVLVVEWALAHREELQTNWIRAEKGEVLSPIAPLE